MAQVKVMVDGVPYFGTVDGDDDLIGAILQLNVVLHDHDVPVPKTLQSVIDIAVHIASIEIH
jgi:hypothetical protein